MLEAPRHTTEKLTVREKHFFVNGKEISSLEITPEKIKDPIPVLIVPGYRATKKVLRPEVEALAKRGRHVISFDHPRQGGKVSRLPGEELQKWYQDRGQDSPKWPEVEMIKAQTLLDLLDYKKIDKVDVVAHSEAAINVSIAAMLHPEKFIGRTIVLYSPAGLIGKDSVSRLATGVVSHPKRPASLSHVPITETEIKNREVERGESKKYLWANPVRALREGLAVANIRIDDMLRYLHEKGVRIIVVQGVEDTFFPMDKMQKVVRSRGEEDGFVDGFLSVRGGHVQIQSHPELYMGAVESMLDQKKREDKPSENIKNNI